MPPDEKTTIHCNFVMAGPEEVWVIKTKAGRYLRWLTTGHALGVKRSLATRFDSSSWAATMLTAIPKDAGARLVRLRTKTRIGAGTWADWKKHGKAAGPIRNGIMLRDGKPDMVVAFPGGRGTANMVDQARLADLIVEHAARDRGDAHAALVADIRRNGLRTTSDQRKGDAK